MSLVHCCLPLLQIEGTSSELLQRADTLAGTIFRLPPGYQDGDALPPVCALWCFAWTTGPALCLCAASDMPSVAAQRWLLPAARCSSAPASARGGFGSSLRPLAGNNAEVGIVMLQMTQAAGKLKTNSIGSLFRGSNSGGSGDFAKAAAGPEVLSTCIGNWLSHLDWDGERCDFYTPDFHLSTHTFGS